MFEGFFDALASVLNFIYTLVPEGLRPTFGFGFAIMGLTVLVMVLITPLTVKSTRSMLQMQSLPPEMNRVLSSGFRANARIPTPSSMLRLSRP